MRAGLLLVVATDDALDDDQARTVALSIAASLQPLGGGGELGAMLDGAAPRDSPRAPTG